VRYHIRSGIDPNYQHPEFLTSALVEAITNNHLEVVKYLLDNGAKPSIKSEFEGVDAFGAARKVNDPDMLALFGLEPEPERLSRWQSFRRWIGF
jgi:ankyrin repeat protein